MKLLAPLLALWLCFLPGAALAQRRAPDRVAVLTMGPGDHPFARFGHNAILLEWRLEGRTLVYNFGTFAFDGLEGVEDFMAGRFRYWLSVSSLPGTLRAYGAQRRSLVAQELELDAGERERLAAALALNARPENRFYDYDYYYDNCSTRVRDVVDKILGGELARAAAGPGRLTFREHTERLTAEAFWLYFGLDLALGPLTDRPIRRWDELFVPGELRAALATTRRHRASGEVVPLVRSEQVYLTADRPPVRTEPPARVLGFLLAGALLGSVLALLGRAGIERASARIAFVAFTASIALVLGLLGNVFFVFWAFTKHWAAHQNANLLVCPPWALVLLFSVFGLLRGRPRAVRLTRGLVALAAAGSALALVLASLPGVGQDNTRAAALLAPLWLGIAFGVRELTHFPAQSGAKGTPPTGVAST